MRIFHDWEFLEDGTFIHPISVGMVAEDGDEYYAEFYLEENVRLEIQENPWVVENVMSKITNNYVKSTQFIREEITEFILSKNSPELWAWYGSYDHVCLSQLFGSMINLPSGIPMFTNDVKTLELFALNSFSKIPDINHPFFVEKPKQDVDTEHHALHDAKHDMALYNHYWNWF